MPQAGTAAAAAKKTKQVRVTREHLSAEILAASANAEARTVDVVFITESEILRKDYWTGEKYTLKIATDPKNARLGRLNNGAPLLDSHQSWELKNIIGSVVPGTGRMENGQGLATVKFSKRPDADAVFQDVLDKIVNNISMGVDFHAFEITEGGGIGGTELRIATDWEPFELSAVPIGADDNAGFLAKDVHGSHLAECTYLTKDQSADPAPKEETQTMPTEAELAALAKAKADKEAQEKKARDEAEKLAKEAATQAERERVQEIQRLGRVGEFSETELAKFISDGTAVEDVRKHVIDQLAKADEANGQSGQTRVELTHDAFETFRSGMENALLHKARPDKVKLEDSARRFMGLSLMELARENVRQRLGEKATHGVSKMRLVELAFHSTSDFPSILANVANKSLRAAYELAPQTFRPIARRTTAPDFKTITRAQLGEMATLQKVNENGEFKSGSISDGAETYQLATYGRILALSRQVIINDDLGAFTRVPAMIGAAVADFESDTVWAVITANANLADGLALFQAGTHLNLHTGGGSALQLSSLNTARQAMRTKKGLDGKQFLNLTPAFLIVPAALEMTAAQLVAPATMLLASTSSAVVPDFIRNLNVIVEPRLDANSTTAWYLAASPDRIDTIEYAYLEGENGPSTETRMGFEVDGMEIKYRLDFAAKALDYRGLDKSAGA